MKTPITFARQLLPIEALRPLKDAIFLDPHYQRQGDVWPLRKQRLLIDSILNGFLVPPMYWHHLNVSSEYFDGVRRYAVVDGRQRLETLFQFMNDEFPLAGENALFSDPTVDLSGLTLTGLQDSYPWLYASFMRTELELVLIETDEIDLIEELFSRLNEGVPLRAAERRNRGRILAPLVRQFAEEQAFFRDRLPFGNTRYRHYDILAKFMRIEDRGLKGGRVPDLKKVDLDRLFERLRSGEDDHPDETETEVRSLLEHVAARLDPLCEVFVSHDRYLSSVGMVTLYFALSHYLADRDERPLTRQEVEHFEDLRMSVKGKNEEDLDDDERLAVEFARYSQGPTSGSYLTARLRIFLRVERGIEEGEDPLSGSD